jgi:excisionase family DNA binding protein
MIQSQLLTPSEVSDILKVNYRKVLDLILLGKLEAIKIGQQYRIPESSILTFLRNNKVC